MAMVTMVAYSSRRSIAAHEHRAEETRWTTRPSTNTEPMATGRASHQRDGPSTVTMRAYCT